MTRILTAEPTLVFRRMVWLAFKASPKEVTRWMSGDKVHVPGLITEGQVFDAMVLGGSPGVLSFCANTVYGRRLGLQAECNPHRKTLDVYVEGTPWWMETYSDAQTLAVTAMNELRIPVG